MWVHVCCLNSVTCSLQAIVEMEIGLLLKNARLKSYYMLGWIIILINLLAQSILVFTPSYEKQWIYPVVYLAILLFVLLFSGDRNKSGWIDRRTAIGVLLGYAVLIWVKWDFYLFAALDALICFGYYFATRKFELVVSQKNIYYPSFPSRHIEWKELQNVIIKDGILTIDFKNDKLLQAEIEGPLNENKFNEFCREQLTK